MILDQLTFLTKIHVENNRIPRRLIPKIRASLKVITNKGNHPKIFAQYGSLIVVRVASGWLATIDWIVEHYNIIEGAPKTSLGTFFKMALGLTRTKNKFWVGIKGYDCDGIWIPPDKDGITMDHAIVFVDGVIALKVETCNDKYFIADYFVVNTSPRVVNEITYLWYDHGREYFKRI